MNLGSRAWRRAACDVVVAVTALLTIVASFWPWFQATLTSTGGGTEGLPAPSGPATGVYAHPSVWAAVGLAAAQIALLSTRYYPGGRLRVPGDDVLLAIASGLMLPLVTADVLLVPVRGLRS
jgi:ABC-type glycerol-3-phosphate transport system permease component